MNKLSLGWIAGLGLATVGACGGEVTVAPGGSGGDNGSSSATGNTGVGNTGNAGNVGNSGSGGSGASGSGGAGAGPCSTHEDCGGGLCLFELGICSTACTAQTCDACGPGFVCDGCGTSSCADCKNCLGACVPIQAGQCDDDDLCLEGGCDYFSSQCQPLCGPDGTCPFGFGCIGCAAGSCCSCENCVDLCFEVDG